MTFAFLDRAIKLFQEFNKLDKDKGFPGARMVIAAGFRVRIKGSDLGKAAYIKSIESRLREGVISSNQAINEAYKSRPYFGLLSELQANFAFTKAYLVDNLGSKGGFGGSNCYIDLSVFDVNSLKGVDFERVIDWEQMGMKGQFGLLSQFDRDSANQYNHQGFLDAFQIASKISHQENITNLLRESALKVDPLSYR